MEVVKLISDITSFCGFHFAAAEVQCPFAEDFDQVEISRDCFQPFRPHHFSIIHFHLHCEACESAFSQKKNLCRNQ